MVTKDRCSMDLNRVIDDLEKLVKYGCTATEDSIKKLDYLLDFFSKVIDNYTREYAKERGEYITREISTIRNIDNIIVYPDLYAELNQILLLKTKHLQEIGSGRDNYVKKLILYVENGKENTLTIRSYNGFNTYIYNEKIDDEWRNLYILGDNVKIKGSSLPFITFIQEYTGLVKFISEINIKNTSLNGLFIYKYPTSSVPGIYNIDVSLPMAFISTDILSKGSISLRIKPIERSKMINLLDFITKGYIFPTKYRQDISWPLYHTLLKFNDLRIFYNNMYSRTNTNELRDFFNQLFEYSMKYVGLVALRTYGRIENRLVIPKKSQINLYWYCLYGQRIIIDSEEHICSNHLKIDFKHEGGDETVVLLIDSSNDIFSLNNNKPILTIKK